MKVYAYRNHRYLDRGRKVEYLFPERGWVEVPDPIGRIVVGDHPDKLVDISYAPDPEEEARNLRDGVQDEAVEVSEPLPQEEEKPTRRRRTSKQ